MTLTIRMLGLLGGKVIGLPPLLNFGSEELKQKVIPTFSLLFYLYGAAHSHRY